jgi:hypothetical protein
VELWVSAVSAFGLGDSILMTKPGFRIWTVFDEIEASRTLLLLSNEL